MPPVPLSDSSDHLLFAARPTTSQSGTSKGDVIDLTLDEPSKTDFGIIYLSSDGIFQFLISVTATNIPF
jgi:hypothetical protein